MHRDLKPANIKVRPDGTVKVLDFGLAKALGTGGGSKGTRTPVPTMSMSPTMTSPAQMSGVGAILGSAVYMAPEQAKGRTVDKRADILAFGVVVYELTGQRLFAADTVPETLAAVLTRSVDVMALPAATPPRLRRRLARCLDRDLRMRLCGTLARRASSTTGTNIERHMCHMRAALRLPAGPLHTWSRHGYAQGPPRR
jgi:serine/threonine protein kinase